jgi:hypothetical protein
LTLTTALLVSCGGGGGGGIDGGGGGGPPITGNFFPLDSGGRWFYFAAGIASKVRVVGPATAGGASGTLVETTDDADGSVIDHSVYVVAADGVRQYSVSVADPITQALDGLQVLHYPLQAGSSSVQLDTSVDLGQDFDGDGRNERLSLRVETMVIGLETVTTAAGTFAGTLHQRQVVDQSVKPTGGSATIAAKVTVDSWYAPDVGLVQTQVEIAGPGIGDSVSESLTAYGVGSRRSESVAPVLQGITPVAPAVRPADATVTAGFSEPMDLSSLAAEFTVRDGAGAAVPGTVTVVGNTATFTPATLVWPSGSYTATVSAASQDRVGNALGMARSWTFNVDETAPGLASRATPMGALSALAGAERGLPAAAHMHPGMLGRYGLFGRRAAKTANSP